MPTEPFAPGRAAAHRTVSYPSFSSCVHGSHSPSEANRPRVSWRTTTTRHPRSGVTTAVSVRSRHRVQQVGQHVGSFQGDEVAGLRYLREVGGRQELLFGLPVRGPRPVLLPVDEVDGGLDLGVARAGRDEAG